ncbi:MAG: molybdopterin-dependent oxidoreductase [Deltaproteobacteria bacterium]|nr:molybdopterin-dependent oxidoreductase [Deltaproteobacteria bacterium]
MKLDRRDFLKIGMVASAAVAAPGLLHLVARKTYPNRTAWQGKTVGDVKHIPSMCQACTTACGIIAHVKDGRLLTVSGNPADPNSRGAICAKGAASPSILYDPYRVLHPLKRVGKRGEGKWKRITWEEAYAEIADKLKKIRESGHPEEFAFQQGRNRSADAVNRFLDAFGTPSHFNHRALCSANRRSAILSTIGDTDWDLGDFENTQYVLNFGCNWAEAHQGHIPIATRMMKGRERGAKIVTFEARLSNTAALSDEWFCVKPGTDGVIALAMAHVICSEGLWDKAWFDTWSNYSADDYAAHVAQYTPERAAAESGVPADAIRRIAREFAGAAPRSTTICARGSHAHRNGYYNDRAITILNALVGNMGYVGGWCWHPLSGFDKKQHPEPEPIPPKPTAKSVIADAKDWPLANAYPGFGMKVGTIVYLWIKEKKQKLSAMMTYNTDQAWSWPEMGLVQEVLKDETLIPFHFCLDVMYSETAQLADIILPWTTYLERWDIDARPSLGLVDYVGLRQPVVKPLGESKDIREIFPELARRIGGGMEKYYPWKTTEEYLEAYFKNVPGGFNYMKKHGAWVDPKKKPNYVPYLKQLSSADLEGSTTDPATGIITKGEDPKTKKPIAIGIMINGIARVGFKTPSRKVEVFSKFLVDKGQSVGKTFSPLPIYSPIPDHELGLTDDQLIMISFKWNVHNAHRTMQSMWLQEIQHSNPAWVNPATASRLGLKDGDWVEVTSYRPRDALVPHGDGSVCGTVKTRVRLTEGVHPQVIAMSHNSGRWAGGPVAAHADEPSNVPGFDADAPRPSGVWWKNALSVAQNNLMPVYPDPITGQQAYHDTIVRLRKV